MFTKSLPKIELHAHLNGSLSCETIGKLLNYHKQTWPNEPMPEGSETWLAKGLQGTLDDPFRAFALIHKITDNTWAVAQATRDVIKEFAEDGVVYLELRSTPRQVDGRMEKEDYLKTVLSEIKAARVDFPGIIVKLIVSVDRRNMHFFDEHVELLRKMRKEFGCGLVAGLDISGDPRQGDIIPLLPKLREIRQDVKLTIHLAEVSNEKEVDAYLKFAPDRIGHGTCIHPTLGGSENLWVQLKAAKIPVEVCLTSNMMGGNVPSLREHHANHFDKNQVPFIICTDDKGVFSCPLSGEYNLAAQEFGWGQQKLFQVAFNAIQHCFASDGEKASLAELFLQWKAKNLPA